jgi:hypothetical protein
MLNHGIVRRPHMPLASTGKLAKMRSRFKLGGG